MRSRGRAAVLGMGGNPSGFRAGPQRKKLTKRLTFDFIWHQPCYPPGMPYRADPALAEFVRCLPKTETHLHLEGACPFELLQRLDPVKYATPPPFWDDGYRYRSFNQFMDLYVEYCAAFFTSADRY